ncbi:MAG: hypothetical protein FWD80_06390 [Propionibacteriaceae bacterium]|nr:hypothetical protein [Propionibacteriaceae bacterium]
MSTTLLRHSITETPDIAQAVDAGQALWPDATRADVMRQLIVLGAETARHNLAARAAAVEAWAGFMPGVYPPDAAVSLKDEWPA